MNIGNSNINFGARLSKNLERQYKKTVADSYGDPKKLQQALDKLDEVFPDCIVVERKDTAVNPVRYYLMSSDGSKEAYPFGSDYSFCDYNYRGGTKKIEEVVEKLKEVESSGKLEWQAAFHAEHHAKDIKDGII